jgi:hypothetical protein
MEKFLSPSRERARVRVNPPHLNPLPPGERKLRTLSKLSCRIFLVMRPGTILTILSCITKGDG